MKIQRGHFVRLVYNQQETEAMVLLASENGNSLMLGFRGAIRTPDGGMMVQSMPLLRDDAGNYRDLLFNEIATITLIEREQKYEH